MTSGPQTNAVVALAAKGRRAPISFGHDTRRGRASRASAASTVTSTSIVAAPLLELLGVQQVGRGARAVEEVHRAVVAAMRERVKHDGRSGARPMPPATTTTSPPVAPRSATSDPNGPRSPSTLPARTAQIAPRDRTDVAHGEDDRAAVVGRAADRDRHLADAEGVDHHELPRSDRRAARRAARLERQRPRVARVLLARSQTRNGVGVIAPVGGRLSERRCCHRRRGVGAASIGAARSAPARSGASGRSRSAGSSSHLPRRQAPSKPVARTGVERARVQVPAVGREEPRPAEHLAGLERLDRHGPRAGTKVSSTTLPWRMT